MVSWRRMTLYAALAVNPFGTVAGVAMVGSWMERRARRRLVSTVAELPVTQWVIVPGALVFADGQPKPALEDRLRTAADVWAAGKASRVLLSGDDGGRRQDEVTPMANFLRGLGVADDAIARDYGAYKTLDTLLYCRDNGLQDVIVCTQRDHLCRVVYLADKVGVRAIGMVADRRRYRDALQDRAYEAAGRALAVLDVHVWRGLRRTRRQNQQPK